MNFKTFLMEHITKIFYLNTNLSLNMCIKLNIFDQIYKYIMEMR